MTKCSRPSCPHELGDQSVTIDGRDYCCQNCYDHCTDESCCVDSNGQCGSTEPSQAHHCCQGKGHHEQGCCQDRDHENHDHCCQDHASSNTGCCRDQDKDKDPHHTCCQGKDHHHEHKCCKESRDPHRSCGCQD